MGETQHYTSFKCVKCGNTQCDVGQMHVSGGTWSKMFNVQSKKFKTVACTQCGYTELYQKPKSGTWENVFDFLVN